MRRDKKDYANSYILTVGKVFSPSPDLAVNATNKI